MRGYRLWDDERLSDEWRGDGVALEFPLYCSGAETTRFAYAVFLLNKARTGNGTEFVSYIWVCSACLATPKSCR